MGLYEAYDLGACIESLKSAEYLSTVVKTRKKTEDLSLLETFRQIDIILKVLGIEGNISDKTIYWVNKLESEYKSDQELRKKDSEELSKDVEALDDMSFRELIDRPVLELSHKGALNPKALLKTSRGEHSAIFDKKIWTRLPDIAKSDFSDCAKCLLTEAPTPASMVGLRGIEAIIKQYYEIKIGNPKKMMLGQMIKELRDLPNANKKLLGYLDYLRSEKRNLAQHPNKLFTQKEAERIFMEIINAVHDIYCDIDNQKSLKENVAQKI